MINKNILTFIISKEIDPIIDCKYCTLNLNNIHNDNIDINECEGIVLNVVPRTDVELLKFIDKFLFVQTLNKNLFHCDKFLQREEYINIHKNEYPTNFLTKFYNYHVNCYDMLKRITYDYYKEFICKNKKRFDEVIHSIKNIEFNKVNSFIDELDRIELGFSYNQINKMYSVHSDGIYKNALIHSHNHEFITDQNEQKKHMNILFDRVVLISNKLKLLVKAYFYCATTNSIIKQFKFNTDCEVDKIILEIYNNTKFARPITNFDVIF